MRASPVAPALDAPPGPACLAATDLIDADHAGVAAFARDAAGGATEPREVAVRVVRAVRDAIRYDPYRFDLTPAGMRGSATLAAGVGWCVPKAVLAAACLRSLGVPARLGFADVRNHLSTERLRQRMGTDVFAWHGYVDVWLDGRWLKATPAFNRELCERFRLLPLEFDGTADSIYHPFDADGQRHMEYLRDRGRFDDLPLADIVADFARRYPALLAGRDDTDRAGVAGGVADWDADVARETGRPGPAEAGAARG